MSIIIDTGPWGNGYGNALEALMRLQNILLQAAEGSRNEDLNGEYRALRRALHMALGKILEAVGRGELDDDLGSGEFAEASRYARRAVHALRNDPMPYATASLLLGLLTLCGFPGIGGYLSGMALAIRKQGPSQD